MGGRGGGFQETGGGAPGGGGGGGRGGFSGTLTKISRLESELWTAGARMPLPGKGREATESEDS